MFLAVAVVIYSRSYIIFSRILFSGKVWVCMCVRGCHEFREDKKNFRVWIKCWRGMRTTERSNRVTRHSMYIEYDLLDNCKEGIFSRVVLVYSFMRVKSVFVTCALTFHATIFPTIIRDFSPSQCFCATMEFSKNFSPQRAERV